MICPESGLTHISGIGGDHSFGSAPAVGTITTGIFRTNVMQIWYAIKLLGGQWALLRLSRIRGGYFLSDHSQSTLGCV